MQQQRVRKRKQPRMPQLQHKQLHSMKRELPPRQQQRLKQQRERRRLLPPLRQRQIKQHNVQLATSLERPRRKLLFLQKLQALLLKMKRTQQKPLLRKLLPELQNSPFLPKEQPMILQQKLKWQKRQSPKLNKQLRKLTSRHRMQTSLWQMLSRKFRQPQELLEMPQIRMRLQRPLLQWQENFRRM
jgi:hypothetical protein